LEPLEGRVAPAVLTVNSVADGPAPDPTVLTLREAVQLVNSGGDPTSLGQSSMPAGWASQISGQIGNGDIIQFDAVLSGQAITLLQGELKLNADVTIVGLGSNQLAVSGGSTSRVFEVVPGAAVGLSSLTIEDGALSDQTATGGGIANEGTLTLTDTVVAANVATTGAGLSNTGVLTLIDTDVANNAAQVNDGGILNTGTLAVLDSTISGNTAVVGNGGVASYGGNVTLINSEVTGNTATGAGGLGNYAGGTMTVLRSVITGNSATGAGGVLNEANLTVIDSTLAANKANLGGGLVNLGGATTLIDSTVTGNSADAGGGLVNYIGSLNLMRSSVVDNTSTGVGSDLLSASGTLSLADSKVTSTWIDGRSSLADPRDVATTLNDHGPAAGPTNPAATARPATAPPTSAAPGVNMLVAVRGENAETTGDQANADDVADHESLMANQGALLSGAVRAASTAALGGSAAWSEDLETQAGQGIDDLVAAAPGEVPTDLVTNAAATGSLQGGDGMFALDFLRQRNPANFIMTEEAGDVDAAPVAGPHSLWDNLRLDMLASWMPATVAGHDWYSDFIVAAVMFAIVAEKEDPEAARRQAVLAAVS
jgi:hypothetical protein